MKKLLLAIVALSGLMIGSNALAYRGCSTCNTCPKKSCERPCEKPPTCVELVERCVPAKKECKTDCWYSCPAGTQQKKGGYARNARNNRIMKQNGGTASTMGNVATGAQGA